MLWKLKNFISMFQAEEWLREQAKAMGWAKATKLEGRPTAQGLVGVGITKEKGIMVEVNCETDFVARNNKFRTLVDLVSSTCLKHQFSTQSLGAEELKAMAADDGSPLADHLALLIGNIGENVSLRRAFCFSVEDGLKISGYTHPAPTENTPILLGKFVGMLNFPSFNFIFREVWRSCCLHCSR